MKSSTILCCDWGSTSFRLAWVRLSDGNILSSNNNSLGIVQTFRNWGKTEGISQLDYFRTILQKAIEQLPPVSGQNRDRVPIVISGMASSSIGMKELAYATLPFHLQGKNITVEQFAATDYFPHQTWLISGVQSSTDVMRGEEVQAIGLTQSLGVENGIYVFPGTHSKHIVVEDSFMIDFKTFMTGELFQVTSTHTMLSASLQPDNTVDTSEKNLFLKKGVEKAQSSNYLNALFSVRTNQLLHQYTSSQNFYYHSGLHIGYELKTLLDLKSNLPIYLCGGQLLTPYYELAFKVLGLSTRLNIIPSSQVELAAIQGMIYIYRNEELGS